MSIVDSHGHIFPPLDGPCGFPSRDDHYLYMQYAMHTHRNQPVVRTRDGAVVANRDLWDADDSSETGRMHGIGFHAGGCGRFTWEKDGEAYHIQFLPPAMTDMASPAETVVTQMDYAGIDRMVLQNDHIYGNAAEIFAEAVARHPDRFIGLAQVEEGLADRDSEIARLDHQVNRLGMRGLYFTLAGFMRCGWRRDYNDPAFRPFWDTVRDLRIPVFWVFPGETPWGPFETEMIRFKAWLEAFDIPSVIVHGWPTQRFADEGGIIAWPELVVRIQEDLPVYPEILYPISCGGREEYPFERSLSHVRQTYDRFGAGRLVWGSDMPNVERYCTYRQSYSYLANRCGYMSGADRAALFGGNLLSLFEGRSGAR